MPRAAAIAILFAALSSVLAAIPGPATVFSAGREYSAELSNPADEELLVAVFRHAADDTKSLVWSRKIEWKGAYRRAFFLNLAGEIKAHLRSDGQIVILRNSQSGDPKYGVRVLHSDQAKDASFQPFKMTELTFAPELPSPLTQGIIYHHKGALLDFLPPDEKSYAIWFAQSDQWYSITLESSTSGIVRDREQIERLNQLGRDRALELVAEHQPAPLRNFVDGLRERAAKLAPSLISAPEPKRYHPETSAAYFFLAARRFPTDRQYSDRLLEFQPERAQMGHPSRGPSGGLILKATVHPNELLLGDFLARRWDGETNATIINRELYLLLPDEPLRSLGIVRFNVDLPFKLPDNPGVLWAYLIPSHLNSTEWLNSDAVWSCRFAFHHDHEPVERVSQVQTIIKGIRPGPYRLKLVWERRPAARFAKAQKHYAARPGDYQSAESVPLLIEPGQSLELPAIACTNRVGNDPSAYGADDAMPAQSKAAK